MVQQIGDGVLVSDDCLGSKSKDLQNSTMLQPKRTVLEGAKRNVQCIPMHNGREGHTAILHVTCNMSGDTEQRGTST